MPTELGKKTDRDSEVGGLRYEQVLLGKKKLRTHRQTDAQTDMPPVEATPQRRWRGLKMEYR